jgi:hypothetical protein
MIAAKRCSPRLLRLELPFQCLLHPPNVRYIPWSSSSFLSTSQQCCIHSHSTELSSSVFARNTTNFMIHLPSNQTDPYQRSCARSMMFSVSWRGCRASWRRYLLYVVCDLRLGSLWKNLESRVPNGLIPYRRFLNHYTLQLCCGEVGDSSRTLV